MEGIIHYDLMRFISEIAVSVIQYINRTKKENHIVISRDFIQLGIEWNFLILIKDTHEKEYI